MEQNTNMNTGVTRAPSVNLYATLQAGVTPQTFEAMETIFKNFNQHFVFLEIATLFNTSDSGRHPGWLHKSKLQCYHTVPCNTPAHLSVFPLCPIRTMYNLTTIPWKTNRECPLRNICASSRRLSPSYLQKIWA